MTKLNYFKMLGYVKTNRLSKIDFAAVCREYSNDVDKMAEQIIVLQWANLSGCDIAQNLADCGDWIYGSNLWNLYFEQRQKVPFEPEVEQLLLEKAKQENMVFSHLPHALSEKAEQQLLQTNLKDILGDYDFPLAATSMALAKLTPVVDGDSPETELSIKACNNSEKLEAFFFNLHSYMERFPLYPESLDLLIETVLKAQKRRFRYFSFENLHIALKTIAVAEKPNDLISVSTQLKLLDFTYWSLEERKMYRPFVQSVLSYYTMKYPAPESIVQKLLQMEIVEPLRELLSHSYLAFGKEAALDKYPELNAEVLLAEICHEACLCNQSEAKNLTSQEYISLLVGNRSDSPLLQDQTKLSMPVLCMRMHRTYSDCSFDSDERYKVMQDAIRYCAQSHFPTLKQYVPRLTEDAKEEVHRVYCL